MEDDEQILRLLEEIRDDQRILIEEYQRVANHALELQGTAVQRQESMGRLYRVVVVAGSVLGVVIIAVIVWLLYVLIGYL